MSENPIGKPKQPGCGCGADGSVEGCYHHDPKRAYERKRNNKKAARIKADKEVREIKAKLKAVAAQVESGVLEPAQANAMTRAYSVLREYILLERGIYREEDILTRLKHLEDE
jgi:hypothetical protein